MTSDYRLLQLLIQYAQEKLAVMEGELGFATIVKQSIINLVKPQFPTIEQVAFDFLSFFFGKNFIKSNEFTNFSSGEFIIGTMPTKLQILGEVFVVVCICST